jgi:hypothetical protein
VKTALIPDWAKIGEIVRPPKKIARKRIRIILII